MQRDFPPAEFLPEQRVDIEHLRYRRGGMQVVVLDEIDDFARIVARAGKRCETGGVVAPFLERDEFDWVPAVSDYPMQRRQSFGRRVIVEDAQDDVALGAIERRDERLRTAKHDLALGRADVSMRAVHADIGMSLQVNVELHAARSSVSTPSALRSW